MSATNGTHYEQLHQGRTKMYKSKVDVVLGAQWGDEGKGKVVDMLASDVDIVCRCQVRTGHNFLSVWVYVLCFPEGKLVTLSRDFII